MSKKAKKPSVLELIMGVIRSIASEYIKSDLSFKFFGKNGDRDPKEKEKEHLFFDKVGEIFFDKIIKPFLLPLKPDSSQWANNAYAKIQEQQLAKEEFYAIVLGSNPRIQEAVVRFYSLPLVYVAEHGKNKDFDLLNAIISNGEFYEIPLSIMISLIFEKMEASTYAELKNNFVVGLVTQADEYKEKFKVIRDQGKLDNYKQAKMIALNPTSLPIEQ